MYNLLSIIFTVSFVVFIVYWRRKVSAKRVAGAYYLNDPLYQSASRIKSIAGAVCVISMIICMLIGE